MSPTLSVSPARVLRIVFDACLIANYPVADLLLRIAYSFERPFTPLWSEQIFRETYRTYTNPKKIAWSETQAQGLLTALLQSFPDSMVSGYEKHIPQCTNSPKDRHVLACAIEGNADLILTYNLRDFGAGHLDRWGLQAVHPQDYLLELHGAWPELMLPHLKQIAQRHSLKLGREVTLADEAKTLSAFVPKFSEVLLKELAAGAG